MIIHEIINFSTRIFYFPRKCRSTLFTTPRCHFVCRRTVVDIFIVDDPKEQKVSSERQRKNLKKRKSVGEKKKFPTELQPPFHHQKTPHKNDLYLQVHFYSLKTNSRYRKFDKQEMKAGNVKYCTSVKEVLVVC